MPKYFYMRGILVGLFYCLSALTLYAQQQVQGKVVNTFNEPIISALVQMGNTYVETDVNGNFVLPSTEKQGIEIKMSGYKPVTIDKDYLQEHGGIIQLQSLIETLDKVVVTGTRKPYRLTKSPVKTEVVSFTKLIETFSPINLVEGVSMVSGLQEVVACGVCGTNSISINGMDGAYTAVLMDGMPIYGNLAAVYGLNGIPSSIIQEVEVVKGPASTLYGTEAVAGVINVRTKDISRLPKLSLNLMTTQHAELFFDMSFLKFNLGDWSGYTSYYYGRAGEYHDENNDGFDDLVNYDQHTVFQKLQYQISPHKTFRLSAKFLSEDRYNGTKEFVQGDVNALRGSSSVYGESIRTLRGEVIGGLDLTDFGDTRLDFSSSYHNQDSYYGDVQYDAQQVVSNVNLTHNIDFDQHNLMLGTSFRQDFYDDNTAATRTIEGGNKAQSTLTPATFAEHDWQWSDTWSMLSGLRLDVHSEHGLIWSPRLNLKWNATPLWVWRLNLGTGFKQVNLFTEDHAFISGQRKVIIEEEIQPERTVNAIFNMNKVFHFDHFSLTFDTDIYYTYFSNKIEPNYDTQSEIRYKNLDGYAYSQGVNMDMGMQFYNSLAIKAGGNIQKSRLVESTVESPILFTPNWSAFSSVSYTLPFWAGFNVSLTSRFVGETPLIQATDFNPISGKFDLVRPIQSKPYQVHTIQFNQSWQDINVYLGVRNIGDFTQRFSPLYGYDVRSSSRGFENTFNTDYAYGPMEGRELYVGLRYVL